MGRWEMVRLGDVGFFQTGGTPTRSRPEYFEGTIPWITTPALGATYIGYSNANAFLTEEAIRNSATKIIPANSLMIGLRVGVGKSSINTVPMCTNQDIVSISDVDTSKVCLEYLNKYIVTQQGYLDSQKRGATIQGIKIELLKDLLIPLPPLEVQQQIADVLDCASALIEKRKAQIDKLDLLVKSQFVEMFGDTAMNPMGWTKSTVEELVIEGILNKPLDGNHGEKHPKGSEYVADGIPFVMANNLVNGTIDYSTCYYITKERAEALDKGFSKNQDVLITHKGTIGRTAIVDDNFDYIMLTPQVTYYRIINGLNNIYLKSYFDSNYFQSLMVQLASSGTTRAYIGITAQLKLPILVPPLDLQNRFASFVEAADKSKFAMRNELAKLEILYKSLMQKCFRGEVY
ncbi:restriction endonuclease subunit S [Synergistaceae bacterium OttesenSCG-928-I11]|nr:restriction endonuclease subunit S [Synergistaceae bacterium OttesenSCG-928-I11]